MEQNPNHGSYITDPSGNGAPTAVAAAAAKMGDCAETPISRGFNLPKLQETCDYDICFSEFGLHNYETVSPGRRAIQPTSSVNRLENGEIDVQWNGCSDKSHQLSLQKEHSNNAAGKLSSDLPELLGECDLRISLNSNQESCVGGQGDKHKSISNRQENGDMAAGKMLVPLDPRRIPWKEFRVDDRDQGLLLPNLCWDEKVVFTLNMVRRQGLFEYNPKAYSTLPTRFCQFNIAFFDLNKESDFKRSPRFSKIPNSYWDLDSSMNIISIKVSKSDVPYPIYIYGTVVARDKVDYRCVYLFKRDRDEAQHIASVDDTLTLTGPYRALAGDLMVFEVNLKIKGDGEAGDQEFSKGLMQHSVVTCESLLLSLHLDSCLSRVEMMYNCIPNALEASVEVNVLNVKSKLPGKITAGDKKNGMVLYNGQVTGTDTKLGCGGSVSLTRRVVAVPWGRDLVLHFSVGRAKPVSVRLEHDEEECTFKLGTYELQVKIIWTGVLRKQRKNVLKHIDRCLVLL